MTVAGVKWRIILCLLTNLIVAKMVKTNSDESVVLGASPWDSTRNVRFSERTISEYSSYSDMEIMVVAAPEMTQNMDLLIGLEAVDPTNCKTLSIQIYYQYGAPPLPPVQTFPNGTYLTRTCAGSEATTLDNKKTIKFPGPLPGLWYIGVLVPQSNGVKRISDLGFGNLSTHSCSFRVSMTASFTVAPTTTLYFIPPDGEKIGDWLSSGVHAKYYKYQHIKNSSRLSVSISGCYLVKDDGSRVLDVCPLTLAIRRKALPIQSASQSKDCFSKDPCSITIPTPEQEPINYYVSTTRIPHLIGGNVYYNVSIHLDECLDMQTKTWLDPGCVPVQAMFPVTSGKVLHKYFYPNRWNSSLQLFPDRPVFFSLFIPPSHVGSTLRVDVFYSVLQSRLRYGRGVKLCLQKGSPAEFYRAYYDEDFIMNCSGWESFLDEPIGASSTKVVVPFPETGKWYISVYQLAYNDESSNAMYLTIQLFAQIQGCIDDCNQHGTCFINTKPDIVYGTCTCDTGYTGWGCERRVDVDIVSVCLLCISNLAFIVDVIIAARLKLFPEMVVYMFLTIMSMLYHLCKTDISCIMDGSFLQLCDFFAITIALCVTLIAMAGLNNASSKATVNMTAVLVLFVSVVMARKSILPFVLTISLGLAIVVFYRAIMWYRGKPVVSYSRKRWALFLLPASILVTLSCLTFALFETVDQYKYVHSLGHVFLGIGIALSLPNHRHRIGHYDVSRQLNEDDTAQSVNSRVPLLGRVFNV